MTITSRSPRDGGGQRLGGSSAKPFGDPFMQGEAAAVFPGQVRDE